MEILNMYEMRTFSRVQFKRAVSEVYISFFFSTVFFAHLM